jgi:hypothetical protein
MDDLHDSLLDHEQFMRHRALLEQEGPVRYLDLANPPQKLREIVMVELLEEWETAKSFDVHVGNSITNSLGRGGNSPRSERSVGLMSLMA